MYNNNYFIKLFQYIVLIEENNVSGALCVYYLSIISKKIKVSIIQV